MKTILIILAVAATVSHASEDNRADYCNAVEALAKTAHAMVQAKRIDQASATRDLQFDRELTARWLTYFDAAKAAGSKPGSQPDERCEGVSAADEAAIQDVAKRGAK